MHKEHGRRDMACVPKDCSQRSHSPQRIRRGGKSIGSHPSIPSEDCTICGRLISIGQCSGKSHRLERIEGHLPCPPVTIRLINNRLLLEDMKPAEPAYRKDRSCPEPDLAAAFRTGYGFLNWLQRYRIFIII